MRPWVVAMSAGEAGSGAVRGMMSAVVKSLPSSQVGPDG